MGLSIRRPNKDGEDTLSIDDLLAGETYWTNGGAGDEMDNSIYLHLDNGGLVDITGGAYYPPDYANFFERWTFREARVDLIIHEE